MTEATMSDLEAGNTMSEADLIRLIERHEVFHFDTILVSFKYSFYDFS